MLKFFTIVFLLLIGLRSNAARCQDSGSQLLENKGSMGYWFPMEIGDRLLKDVTELKLVREKVALLTTKIEAQDRLIELMQLDIQVSEDIGVKWQVAFDEQVKVTQTQQAYYENQLAASKKWYRSPVLWCGIGALIASAMAIGLNFGLAEAHK